LRRSDVFFEVIACVVLSGCIIKLARDESRHQQAYKQVLEHSNEQSKRLDQITAILVDAAPELTEKLQGHALLTSGQPTPQFRSMGPNELARLQGQLNAASTYSAAESLAMLYLDDVSREQLGDVTRYLGQTAARRFLNAWKQRRGLAPAEDE